MAFLVDYHLLAQPLTVSRDPQGQFTVDPVWKAYMTAGGDPIIAINSIHEDLAVRPSVIGPWLGLFSPADDRIECFSRTKRVVELSLQAGWLPGAKINPINSPIWTPVGNRHIIHSALLDQNNAMHTREAVVVHAAQSFGLKYQVQVLASFFELVEP